MCADLHSQQACHDADQKLLVSEQHIQKCWCCESPSTDALYKYVAWLADSWLHVLVQENTTMQEEWQAHAKTAHLGHTHCRQLR